MERIADLLISQFDGSSPPNPSAHQNTSYAESAVVMDRELPLSNLPHSPALHEPLIDASPALALDAVANTLEETSVGAGADAGIEADLDGVTIPQEDLNELWENVLAILSEQFDAQIINAWIRGLELTALRLPASFEGEVVATLVAPNRFCCDHVQRNYSAVLISILGKLLSAPVKLTFRVEAKDRSAARTSVSLSRAAQSRSVPFRAPESRDTDSASNDRRAPIERPAGPEGKDTAPLSSRSSAQNPPQARASSQLRSEAPNGERRTRGQNGSGAHSRPLVYDETNLNPKYNFSNFVVGACNQFAHALGLRVAENLGSTYNPLFIYGGVGLGKTHLANAIGNASVRRHKRVLLVSSETFVSELIASLRGNRMDQFKSKFRSLDLLIIDDIQFIIGKERTQEEFFHTFNELYNRHKQIVITSDKIPQDLVGLEERLRTRFASGLSVDLQAPDFETRVAILSKKAEGDSVHLTEEVCRFIAERIDTNVRELEGALNRLCALSSLHRLPINIALAQEVIKSLMTARRTQEITYELIQQSVAEAFNVSLSDLLGKRRTQNIALARQVAMFLVRRMTGYSYPEIGAFFGGRDHSTVIHANKIITERLGTEDELRVVVSGIERALKS